MNRDTFFKSHGRLIEHLLRKARTGLPALQGHISAQAFSEALYRSVEHRFRDEDRRANETATYLESLHIEDLALACACSEGNDQAWEHFIAQFRPVLYVAARAITGDEPSGRELADSIYVELYGLGQREASPESSADRRSLFNYFHGRSKLSTRRS